MVAEDDTNEARRIDDARQSSEKLAELLESQRPVLMACASRELDIRILRRVDAGDVVQQVLIDATESFSSFRGTSLVSLRAWLHRITQTTIQDLVRTHIVSQKRSVACEAAADDSAAHRRLNESVSEIPTPRTRLIAAEKAEKLEAVLYQLPESQRNAIRLRYFENRTVQEIADEMGKSPTATAGLLKRGLSKLRLFAKDDDILS